MSNPRMFYALLNLSVPCIYDRATGKQVSFKLSAEEADSILEGLTDKEIAELAEEALFFFGDTGTVFFKQSRWSPASPVRELKVSSHLELNSLSLEATLLSPAS